MANSVQVLENNYWKCVYGPPLEQKVRTGCWILFIDENEIFQDWETIKHLTENGHLGYYSAISPAPMTNGYHAECFTICVHTDAADNGVARNNALAVLESNFQQINIIRYQINFDATDDADEPEESESEEFSDEN